MDDIFSVTEPKSSASPRTDAVVDLCRSHWELENRNIVLERELNEQTSLLSELRDRLERTDSRQRELLKGLAKILDECDDTLQVESMRLNGADPDDPVVRQARKWYRKVDRTRQNLMDRLSAYGVSTRHPVGMPDPEFDTIHSTMETDAIGPGEIVKVLRTGLLWNDTAIRCSLVVVAASEAEFDEETGTSKLAAPTE